jgi:hypothetical protein
MTEQIKTEDYRDVLEDLARSRGLDGAEELARRAAEVDPDFSPRQILEADVGGVPLDRVLALTDEEKLRLTSVIAHADARGRGLGICGVPGCRRPADNGSVMQTCPEHRKAFDAQANEKAWDLALSILGPWVEATRKIGSDELTRVMESALAEAERELNRVLDEREAAEAALESA